MTGRRNSTDGRAWGASRIAWWVAAGLLGGAIVGGLAGCVAGQPNIMHPGDLQSQRYNAIAHDPYADSDAGPEVVGGRPREFQKPLPEPVRNRWLMDSWWARR